MFPLLPNCCSTSISGGQLRPKVVLISWQPGSKAFILHSHSRLPIFVPLTGSCAHQVQTSTGEVGRRYLCDGTTRPVTRSARPLDHRSLSACYCRPRSHPGRRPGRHPHPTCWLPERVRPARAVSRSPLLYEHPRQPGCFLLRSCTMPQICSGSGQPERLHRAKQHHWRLRC